MSDNGAWMRDSELFWQSIQGQEGNRIDYGGRHTIRLKRRPPMPDPVDACPSCGGKRYRQERESLLRPEGPDTHWEKGKPPAAKKATYTVLVCTSCWKYERTY